MSIIVILVIIFVVWLIVANINSINEGKRQMRESARLQYIKEHYPEAYNEYCTWEARNKYGRSRIPEVIGWDDKTWELQNAMLLVKKNQRERSEKEEKWAKEQHDFAEQCVAIAKKKMPGFGFYKYYPKISTVTKDGKPTNMDMLVWQHFPNSLCLCEDLDYTNVQYAKNNLANLPKFKNKTRYFTDVVYDKIVAFIKELRKEDESLLIYLNFNIKDWSTDALKYHYGKIIDGLGTSHIVTSPTNLPIGNDSKHWENKLTRKLVIIDMMTENEWLNWNCTHVFENIRDKHPLICYISLLKCFDRQEMIDVISHANAEAEKRVADERLNEEKQKLIKQSCEDRKWEEEQKAFSSKVYTIAVKHIPNIGSCNYSVNYDSSNNEGKPYLGSFSLWQFFPLASCLEENLDYTNCEDIKNNTQCIQVFRKYGIKLDIASVSKPINKFFVELAANWKCLFFFNDEIKFWSDDALNVTYRSLKTPEGCKTLNIARFRSTNKALGLNNTYSSAKESLGDQDCEVIVIVDAFTANGQLFKNIQEILPLCRNHHPKIIYLSLLKCYDRKEMLEVISVREKEAEKRKVEEKVKEEERKRKDAETKELEERKRKAEEKARLQITAKDVLVNNAKDWEPLYGDFYYTWLFYYYPTTCDFEANESEWHDRRTIWNFKNDPDKNISSIQHEDALSNVIPQIHQRLSDSFGEEYLQFLTLVCLPASTKVKNAARYYKFSKWLCEETGMENAYDYVHIVQDGMSKKDPQNTTGRSIQPVVEYDKDYFKGRNVLLFDDVVTKGGTMLRYKEALEREGATVIGGFCLGKTKHERPIQGGMSNSSAQIFPPQPTTFSDNDFELPF